MSLIKLLNSAIVASIVIVFSTNVIAVVISESADLVIKNVLYQIKTTVKESYSPEKIESWINDGKKLGVKEYRLDRYNTDIGWSILDSKNREVVSAIFKIENNRTVSGKYFGALAKKDLAQEIHAKHIELLNTYYSRIGKAVYSLGDGCSAKASLFEGSTGLGRTIIEVQCN